MAKRVLSNSVTKTHIALDDLPPGSVILDGFGHAWQSARSYGVLGATYATGYWYRAYDGDDASEVATHELAALGPITVIHEPR